MSEYDKMNPKAVLILPNDDPLGIRKVSLCGAPPSLQVEAKIAVKQWASQNNINHKRRDNVRSQTKKS